MNLVEFKKLAKKLPGFEHLEEFCWGTIIKDCDWMLTYSDEENSVLFAPRIVVKITDHTIFCVADENGNEISLNNGILKYKRISKYDDENIIKQFENLNFELKKANTNIKVLLLQQDFEV